MVKTLNFSSEKLLSVDYVWMGLYVCVTAGWIIGKRSGEARDHAGDQAVYADVLSRRAVQPVHPSHSAALVSGIAAASCLQTNAGIIEVAVKTSQGGERKTDMIIIQPTGKTKARAV